MGIFSSPGENYGTYKVPPGSTLLFLSHKKRKNYRIYKFLHNSEIVEWIEKWCFPEREEFFFEQMFKEIKIDEKA